MPLWSLHKAPEHMQADFFFWVHQLISRLLCRLHHAVRCGFFLFILASFHVRKQLQENKNLHKLKEKIYIFFKYIC